MKHEIKSNPVLSLYFHLLEFISLQEASRYITENTNFKGKNKTSKIKAVCDGERPPHMDLNGSIKMCRDYPESTY